MNAAVIALLVTVWAGLAVAVVWTITTDVLGLDRRHHKPEVGEPPSNVNVFWPDQ